MQFNDLGTTAGILIVATAGLLGIVLGPLLGRYVVRLGADRPRQGWMSIALGLAWRLLGGAMILRGCQQIPYVAPDAAGRWGRVF